MGMSYNRTLIKILATLMLLINIIILITIHTMFGFGIDGTIEFLAISLMFLPPLMIMLSRTYDLSHHKTLLDYLLIMGLTLFIVSIALLSDYLAELYAIHYLSTFLVYFLIFVTDGYLVWRYTTRKIQAKCTLLIAVGANSVRFVVYLVTGIFEYRELSSYRYFVVGSIELVYLLIWALTVYVLMMDYSS